MRISIPAQHRIATALNHNLFEWVALAAMMGIVSAILIWPSGVERSALRSLLATGLTPHGIAFIVLLFGASRLAGLINIGRQPFCAERLRAIGASGGAFLWWQIALGAWVTGSERGVILPTVVICFCFAAGEVVAVYRAAVYARCNVG